MTSRRAPHPSDPPTSPSPAPGPGSQARCRSGPPSDLDDACPDSVDDLADECDPGCCPDCCDHPWDGGDPPDIDPSFVTGLPPSGGPGHCDAGTFDIDDPLELVVAVPALLGFHPHDSLVLVSIGGSTGNRVGLTLRIDLPPLSAGSADFAAVTAAAVDGVLLDEPRGAAVLVFAADPAGVPGSLPPYAALVAAVQSRLLDRGVEPHTVLWAENTARGARWGCYLPCRCTGQLPDPAVSPLVAATVLEGRVLHGSRAEVEQLIAPTDPAALLRREELLRRVVDEAGSVLDVAAQRPAATLRTVDRAIAAAAAGRLRLDDDQVVELACALAVPAVRDAAMRRCVGGTASAAEQLWTVLVRETPDPEAAEPAALLAVSALLRGDGALANIALDRAERAWPGHRLTTILRSVAVAGMRPAEFRHLLRDFLGGPAGEPPGRAPKGARVRRSGGGSARRSRRRRPSS